MVGMVKDFHVCRWLVILMFEIAVSMARHRYDRFIRSQSIVLACLSIKLLCDQNTIKTEIQEF